MNVSKVTWTITRTIRTSPEKAKKNIFKRIYHCHFNTDYRPPSATRTSGSQKRKHASRNISCPATLTIFLVHIPKRKSRSKSLDGLAKDWPCKIQFLREHNHTILSATALTRRPIGDSTKHEILEYFERGHSVSSAYHSFCFKKMEEWGDEYNTLSADRHYFPNKTDFQNLWAKHFKSNYGERTGVAMFNKLEENLTNSKVSYKISYIDNHYAISLCTPIMKRASNLLAQSSEILFVDATSNCDVQNHKIYFFATQSAVGGIPLGCIISTSQKEELFDIAVKNLLDVNLCNISPKIILTDDDLTERKILQKHWPESKMLLCTFHVLKAVWKWLNIARNGILKDDRPYHYKLFKNILYSQTKEDLDINIQALQANAKYENYKKYINNKIKDIQSWSLYYRKDLKTRGSDTNNTVEVMFRIFKDIPLERTKAYNLSQLADFISSDFESYYKQRLLDVCFNKVNKNTISRLCPNAKDVSFSQVKHFKDMEYCVLTENNIHEKYFVDLSIGVCSCPIGFSGKICKHQSCIILNIEIENVINVLTTKNRWLYFKIATGSEPPEELLAPLIINKDVPHSNKLVHQPSTSQALNNDSQNINTDNSEAMVGGIDISTDSDDVTTIESEWAAFMSTFNEKVINGLKDDPVGFTPAIRSCITSFHKNVNSSSSLVSSLYTLFKPHMNQRSTINKRILTKTTRKGKKIGVQPTSIARRKTLINGRRKLLAGRHTDSLVKKKRKAVHSLSKCVESNISLGDNKFVK